MKTVEYIRLIGALVLAAMTLMLFFNSGPYGAAGAYICGTFVSTLLLAMVGGRRRPLHIAVATIPPYLVVMTHSIIGGADTPTATFGFWVAVFGGFVALPLLFAFFANYLSR